MATTASADDFPIERRSVKALALLQVKRTYDLFGGQLLETAPIDDEAKKIKITCKVGEERGLRWEAQHASGDAGLARRVKPGGPCCRSPPACRPECCLLAPRRQ